MIFALTAAFFAVFFFWPIVEIVKGGFIDADGRPTLAYLAALLSDPLYLRGFANAFLLACVATALALALGLPLAIVSDRYDFPGKGLFGWLALVPMILPPFVGAIGIRQMFGRYGALNALLVALRLHPHGWGVDWTAVHPLLGVAIVDALSLYPVVYLNVLASLSALDPSMEEAAQNLGCTGLRRFRRIVLPLVRPGLFAGGTLVFIWAFTDLGTPLIFDFREVASVQVYDGLEQLGGNPFPYALVAAMLAASVLLYGAGRILFGRTAEAPAAKSAARGACRRHRLSWLCTALFAVVTFCALLPHLGVVGVAFSRNWYASVLPARLTLENFRMGLGNPLTVPAIANSLLFASLATLVDLVLGVGIAAVVVRSRIPARRILDALVMLPLAVPGLVLAFGYLAMTRQGRLLAFLDPVRNPTVLLVIAYSVRRIPYVARAAIAGFQQTSVALEEAARNLGAPPLKVLWRITLPLISANLVAGALLAFSFAMLEVSDSLVLAQKQAYYPITKAILELFQLLGDGKFMASALGVWAMAFLAVTIAGMTLLLGRRLSAIFRL